jgi:hypothetical protein
VSNPASSTNFDPVIERAWREARNTTAAATSSGSIHGIESKIPADRSAISRGD